MAHRGIDSRLDLIELQLERIADALEDMLPLLEKLANPMIYVNPPPPPPLPQPYGGYRCGSCGTWVMPGTMHTCTGKQWPTTSPNICRSDPDLCSSTWRGPKVMVYNEGVTNFPLSGTAVGDLIT